MAQPLWPAAPTRCWAVRSEAAGGSGLGGRGAPSRLGIPGRSWWPGFQPEQGARRPAWSADRSGRWHWHTRRGPRPCRQVSQLAAKRSPPAILFQAILSACCEVVAEQRPDSAGALSTPGASHCPGTVRAAADQTARTPCCRPSTGTFPAGERQRQGGTRPIKGTRPRHGDAEADAAAAAASGEAAPQKTGRENG